MSVPIADSAGYIVLVEHINASLEANLRDVTEYAVPLREALERIAANGPYAVNGGHACATCHTFWHPDPTVIKFQDEHHHDRCAYAIARAALADPRGIAVANRYRDSDNGGELGTYPNEKGAREPLAECVPEIARDSEGGLRAAAERMVQTYQDWMAGCANDTRTKEVEAAHINLRDALRHQSGTNMSRPPAPWLHHADRLPCAVACDRGPTFGKGVLVSTLLAYFDRRKGYDAAADPNFAHTCGLPEDHWSREGPSKDCPLCKARASFTDMRHQVREVQGTEFQVAREVPEGWIPVSERLPKPNTRVLTYTLPSADMLLKRAEVEPSDGHTKADAIAAIAAFDWHIGQWIEYEGSGWWSPEGARPPTHWMPLPAAPCTEFVADNKREGER